MKAEPIHEDVVEHAMDVVVHPFPHLRRHGRWNGPRKEHRRAHDGSASDARVEEERDAEAEGELERYRERGEEHGEDRRVEEKPVLRQLHVVREPHESGWLVAAEASVREAQVQGADERVKRHEGRDDERRGQERPRDQSPPPRAAPAHVPSSRNDLRMRCSIIRSASSGLVP